METDQCLNSELHFTLEFLHAPLPASHRFYYPRQLAFLVQRSFHRPSTDTLWRKLSTLKCLDVIVFTFILFSFAIIGSRVVTISFVSTSFHIIDMYIEFVSLL